MILIHIRHIPVKPYFTHDQLPRKPFLVVYHCALVNGQKRNCLHFLYVNTCLVIATAQEPWQRRTSV